MTQKTAAGDGELNAQADQALAGLIRDMNPVLQEGVYVFSAVAAERDLGGIEPVGWFQEPESLTVICDERAAFEAGLPILFRAAWITLTVQSQLDAVGLTAAVSRVLADAGISCNVVAGALHDHLFVPVDSRLAAMHALQALQEQGP